MGHSRGPDEELAWGWAGHLGEGATGRPFLGFFVCLFVCLCLSMSLPRLQDFVFLNSAE